MRPEETNTKTYRLSKCLKITELQVDNLVKVTDDDTMEVSIGRVTALDAELGNVAVKLQGEEVAYPFSIDCIEPIGLMPEVLRDYGFVAKHHPGTGAMKEYTLGQLCIEHNTQGGLTGYFSVRGLPCYELRWLHQLQNLMTGCNIKPTTNK